MGKRKADLARHKRGKDPRARHGKREGNRFNLRKRALAENGKKQEIVNSQPWDIKSMYYKDDTSTRMGNAKAQKK